ncbi:SspB-related isopeptide-forming adhesin, partial [Streptococcus hyointestinalis]
GHGFFRKSKAYGLVCGIALTGALVFAGQANADEVTTTTSTDVSVTTTANPATNLTQAQTDLSQDNTQLATQANTQTGTITSPVTSQELDNAVNAATAAGVTVTEEKTVSHDSLEKAQDDLSQQTAEVKAATENQEANTTAIKEATEENARIDAENKAEAERVEAINKAGQANVDAINASGQAAVDQRNQAGQAAVEAENATEKAKIDAENVKRKADYDKAVAEIQKVEEYNAGVRERNAAKAAVIAEKNRKLKEEYEAKLAEYNKALAEMQAELDANRGKDGYLTQDLVQSLVFDSEPNATAVVESPDGEKSEVDNDVYNLNHKYFIAKGQTLKVTYTNLENSSYNGTKISKVVYTYTALTDNGDYLYPFKDPTQTVNYNAGGDPFTTGKSALAFTAQFFDKDGNVISFSKDAPALIAINSMNNTTNFSGTGYGESITDLGENTEFIKINGSSVDYNNGVVYSATDNAYVSAGSRYESNQLNNPNEYWDSTDSPLRWYGAGVLKVTSGDTISFTIQNVSVNAAFESLGQQWFAFSSKVAAPTLPTPPTPPTPDKFTAEPEKELPPTPTEVEYLTFKAKTFTPETYTPVTYTPVEPTVKPHVSVPEKVTYSAKVHPVVVTQTPTNVKGVVNSDGVSVDGKLVAKGTEQTWTLASGSLKAGREEIKGLKLEDPFPSGVAINRESSSAKSPAWTFVYNDNGKSYLVATAQTLALLNANRDQDVIIPVANVVGTPLNDGGTYPNTFKTIITTPSGSYTTVSNTPVYYTPGNDPKTPRNPGGDNPTPHDNLIQPTKDVVDDKGQSINGQSILLNTPLNYVAKQDFDQYQGMEASQAAIAKGFAYIDDYSDEALDGDSMTVKSITAKNGDDVSSLLQMYHVLSADTLDDKLKELVKQSGISPVGEFYMWVAKDPDSFYKAYVKKGLDVTYNLSFKVKQSFTEGDITNQTYQIDFGNGYYGNIVTNNLPPMVVHKVVKDKDGTNIDGQTVAIGDEISYELEGWVVPAGRGYDLYEYRFVDILDKEHDAYEDYQVTAKVDLKLSDGTIIEAGKDLKAFTEVIYNAQTGQFELKFKDDFLKQIERSQAFGADAKVLVKRIAAGEVTNEYTLYVNGNPILSNKVVTKTPEPEKPKTPATPTETPAQPQVPVTKQAVLPSTGERSSIISIVAGIVLGILGAFGLVRKKEQ